MTLTQLTYVTEIVKAGSINKAAYNLFVSQSVLSTSVKNLEKELGKQIFIRTSHGVQLTPFGHTFTSYVASIQTQLQQLNAIIVRETGRHSLSLSIASNGFYFINDICARLYDKYRSVGIRIDQYDDFEEDAINLVSGGLAEIGVLRLWSCYHNMSLKQLKAQKLQFYPIAQMPIAITVGPKNPLFYSESSTVGAEELKSYPPIMYSNMDAGPYSDIFERLKLPISSNRFVTSSRAVIYETLASTDAYYLNSLYPPGVTDGRPGALPGRRSLILSGCTIKSEVGWIKRESYIPTPIALEAVNLLTERFG